MFKTRMMMKHINIIRKQGLMMNPTRKYTSVLFDYIPSVYANIGSISLAGIYFYMNFKVAEPHEKIVVTGPFIKDEMKICKKVLILPFQKYKLINTQAHSINTIVSAMTKEKIPFDMPMYFTVSPDDSLEHTLSLYAKKFGDKEQSEITNIIESVVHGEARLLTGSMEVEHIFANRSEFQKSITDKIQECLIPFGIKVDNVNIGELKDSQKCDYFKNLSERSLQKAQRDANVATAEHQFNTDSEKKGFEAESRKRMAYDESVAVIKENDLQEDIIRSRTKLAIFEANQLRDSKLASLEAEAVASKKHIDLQTEIEMLRKEQMIEQQKAEDLSKTLVNKEILLVKTDAEAEQIKRLADAEAYKKRAEADALLYHNQREADGILAIQNAKAEGLKRNVNAVGGNVKFLESYKMVDEGRHENIAAKYSEAVKGMNPTILTNGSDGSVSKVLSDIGGSVSALVNGYEKQTGINLLNTFLQPNNNNSNVKYDVKYDVEKNNNSSVKYDLP